MSLPAIQRVVTGHDASGNSVVSSCGPLPNVYELSAFPGITFHEIWTTDGSPAKLDNGEDPTLGSVVLTTTKGGTHALFVDFAPEAPDAPAHDINKADSPHPQMHRTETIDYGVVIEGEMTLVLDKAEVPLGPGSVVVQRGTNHAWVNRSGRTCRVFFVLADGAYDPAIAHSLSGRNI
jgi:mannose-6-phosphate isomerase-like protein (cupin superfamily)